MLLFDTHCHLDEESFDVDRNETLERASAAGVVGMLSIGTTAATSQRAVEIAAKYASVHAVVGIQPNYVSQAAPGDWETVERLASAPRVVAIGETGLDKYWDYAPLELQVDYFQRHLQLSQSTGLPFVVHCREAEAEVLEQLRQAAERGPLSGVMHSFAGTAETARACLELGMHMSFSGMVTYKKSQALRELVKEIPLERLLIETDAPYLAPQPVRGKRNEPAFVRFTADCLADLLGMPVEDLARTTSENASRLFRVMLPEDGAPGAGTTA